MSAGQLIQWRVLWHELPTRRTLSCSLARSKPAGPKQPLPIFVRLVHECSAASPRRASCQLAILQHWPTTSWQLVATIGMPTILVTGGAGFIGSHLVEALVQRGDRVRVLDNFAAGKVENLVAIADDIELLSGDVCDEAAVKRAVAGCEVVFHQAALASVPRGVHGPLAAPPPC